MSTKPVIFIWSSYEAVNVAKEIQRELKAEADLVRWDQDVFTPSKYFIPCILEAAAKADFGLFIFTADDQTQFRGTEHLTARDNLYLELGLFAGQIGIDRCLILADSNLTHTASDLQGLTVEHFDPKSKNLSSAIGPGCTGLLRVIKSRGQKDTAPISPTSQATAQRKPMSDPDILIALRGWVAKQGSLWNPPLAVFAEVDSQLGLPEGSAKRLLIEAAKYYSYTASVVGEDSVYFSPPGPVLVGFN
ncbi:MAG: nucleotide-binding protein [bacterium]